MENRFQIQEGGDKAQKVLHVIEGVDKNLGGQPTALFGILGIESRLGLESQVLSIQPPEGTFDQKCFNQRFHFFIPSFPSRFKKSYDAVNWLKKNIDNYDLLVFHGIWNFLVFDCLTLAIKHKKKYLIWPHGSLVPFDLKKKALLKRILGSSFLKNVFNGSAGLCLTSTKEDETFERYKAIVKTFILPLPVSLAQGRVDRLERFDEKRFVFVFVGRIDYKKGLDLLIKTFRDISKQFPAAFLDIWGTGTKEYTAFIDDLIKQSNLSEKVKLKGFLESPAKREVFHNSDCFILPSMFENFGIAPIEALQGGIPILITNKVDIWVEVQEAAWICEYDLPSLSEKMREVLSNEALYQRKKQSAASVGNKFLPENLLFRYSKLYQEILENE